MNFFGLLQSDMLIMQFWHTGKPEFWTPSQRFWDGRWILDWTLDPKCSLDAVWTQLGLSIVVVLYYSMLNVIMINFLLFVLKIPKIIFNFQSAMLLKYFHDPPFVLRTE